jgi:hypothetical protein
MSLKRGRPFRGAAFMGLCAGRFCNGPSEECPNAGAAYGYAAKSARIGSVLGKGRAVDAGCTGGNPRSTPLEAI